MIIVFLGPPGAGKGTQCKMLVDRYNMLHISSGDILRRHRKEGTELGQKAQSYMDAGDLVPDDLIVAMMIEEMKKIGQGGGFILDGFPRTIGQARELDAALEKEGKSVDVALCLEVDDSKLEERITGRRSCSVCGKAYHIQFNPPRQKNQCDNGCGPLVQRPDDTEDVVRNRIKTYHDQTAPLVAYYQNKGNLQSINGDVGIEQVRESLFEVLDKIVPAR
ncbi:MAG: adenylate kinase [Sedimentisphaerales bacterium]|nr:adenylate kinase [Sedimentisphaerales bacterium]